VLACPASAQLYSDADLNTKLSRIKPNLVATVEKDIPEHVDPAHSSAVRDIKIELPLRGANALDFHAAGKTIVVPVEGLQFFDDLASLRAWLDKHRCESKTLLFPNYLYHLAQGTRLPNPLAAFGLRSTVLLRDTFINDTSYKYYTSAVWFIIAHEIGHVALGHRAQRGEASVAQERAADAFAIDVMRRRRLNPAGIYLYFLATSFYEPINGRRTHPMSGDRIRAPASEIKKTPEAFVAPESTRPSEDLKAVLRIAEELNGIATRLGEIQMRRGDIERRSGSPASIDQQVFPKIDFTLACPQGRTN
jgi:Peptidase U49